MNLLPCPSCGGPRTRKPSGEPYCSLCASAYSRARHARLKDNPEYRAKAAARAKKREDRLRSSPDTLDELRAYHRRYQKLRRESDPEFAERGRASNRLYVSPRLSVRPWGSVDGRT